MSFNMSFFQLFCSINGLYILYMVKLYNSRYLTCF